MENTERIIVGLGEVLWDLLPDGPQLGGAPANFAYHAGQFGFHSMVISALGNDALGEQTVQALKHKKLDAYLPRVSYPTGTVEVSLTEAGIPSYLIREQVAWDYVPFSVQTREWAECCRAVCWGTLAQRNEVTRQTIYRFLEAVPSDCLKLFDMNLRQHYYTKEVVEASMNRCDLLKINDEELACVDNLLGLAETDMESSCRRLIKLFGMKWLILTCGTRGSYVFTSDECSFLKTPLVEVCDTVGAGDSFTGSFCAALLKGKSVNEAHRLAVDVSAYVCTRPGAMPDLPGELISSIA